MPIHDDGMRPCYQAFGEEDIGMNVVTFEDFIHLSVGVESSESLRAGHDVVFSTRD